MSKRNTLFVFYIFLLNYVCIISEKNIDNIVSKYEGIIENVEQVKVDGKVKFVAKKEISTNKQIVIIPTKNILSSEEDYQFKQYFSKSHKEKLIGRLLIERFLGNESFFYNFIEDLPKTEEINDYYHFSDEHKTEFTRRSMVNHNFSDRKSEYESLIRKIPSNEIPSLLLNFELYNWASSILDCFGIQMKKKYFSEVKRLFRQVDSTSDEEIVLIPSINLFENGPFKYLSGNNLMTSLFAYKEHIYLNSDRFIDETEEIFNEIQFTPNIRLFETCGKIISGFHHEEMKLTLTNKDWTMQKFNLCKETECIPKKLKNHFVLKYEFDHKLLNYCEIDQITDDQNLEHAFKMIRGNKKISQENYLKALTKCSVLIKEFMNKSKKTNIAVDIKDFISDKPKDNREKTILKYVISQKKMLNYHIKMFHSRLIKEFNTDIFGSLKGQYV